MRRLALTLRDFIFPILEPFPPGYEQKLRSRKESLIPNWNDSEKKKFVPQWKENAKASYEKEEDRRKHFDARLTTVLSLLPVSIVLTLGVSGLLFSSDTDEMTKESLVFFLALSFYTISQLLLAFQNALKGLMVRGYYRPFEFLPKKGESRLSFEFRFSCELVIAVLDNTEENNAKANFLKLAYTALR